MTQEEMLESLKIRLGVQDSAQDTLMTAYLSDAGAQIIALSGREKVIAELENAQVRLAAVLYAKRGAEGETQRQEGDVSRTFQNIPDDIMAEISAYRVCHT